jgi:hypothetical protein
MYFWIYKGKLQSMEFRPTNPLSSAQLQKVTGSEAGTPVIEDEQWCYAHGGTYSEQQLLDGLELGVEFPQHGVYIERGSKSVQYLPSKPIPTHSHCHHYKQDPVQGKTVVPKD